MEVGDDQATDSVLFDYKPDHLDIRFLHRETPR